MDFSPVLWHNCDQNSESQEGVGMEQSERYPSYVVSVANALSTSVQPLTIDTLVEKVRGQRPVSKGARSAVYRALKQLYQAVPVGEGQYGWLTHLLHANVFRHPLSAEESKRGFLMLDELEHAVFFPQFFQTHRPDSRNLKIELMGGPVVECEAAIERRTWSLRLGAPFVEWVEAQGGQGHDDIIIMVVDAAAGHYVLRLQPREARDEQVIRDRNARVAGAAEELVADWRRSGQLVPTWELAALLIGRSLFADPTPPDDLHLLLQRHSNLALLNGKGYVIKSAQDAAGTRAPARSTKSSSSVDSAGADFPRHLESSEGEMDFGPEDFEDGEVDSCEDYEEYLEQLAASGRLSSPLSHSDYHLLEAELEMLVSLEQEFGYLMPDQQTRVNELADRIFIDPEVLRSNEQDGYDDDEEDMGGPQFWQN
jgi:hypothetical protein